MSKSSGFLLGAIIGGTAAAVTALLLAPKAGKELREELADQLDGFKEKAYDYGDYVQEKGAIFSTQAAEFADDVKERTVKTSEEALSAFRKQTDHLSDRFRQTADEVTAEATDLMDEGEDILLDASDLAEDIIDTGAEHLDQALEDLK